MPEGFGGDKFGRNLSGNEIAALSLVEKHRKKVAESFPEIEDDFRSGLANWEIAKKYNIAEIYNVTDEIAKSLVRAALLDLIEKDDYDRIIAEHAREKNLRGDRVNREKGTGIYGMNSEEKSKAGAKGGKKTHDLRIGFHAITTEERSRIGMDTYNRGVGVHGQTKEQLSQLARLNKERGLGIFGMTTEQRREQALRTLEKVGKDVWNGHADSETGLDEGQYCMELSKDPNFQFSSGLNKGKPDSQKIAKELNQVFPPGKDSLKTKERTPNAVITYIKRHKKPMGERE